MKDFTQIKSELQAFANKHEVILDLEGECGFGRECVGFRHGDNWVAFNPTCYPDHACIPDLEDERHYDIAPANAYHKGDYTCVLGRSEDRVRELHGWSTALESYGAELVRFNTGATGMQALFSGTHGMAWKLTKAV